MQIDIPAHYAVAQITTMDEVHQAFPDGKANEYNWLFLSTSGVHGWYTTLDELEHPDPDDGDEPPAITVLIVKPRVCVTLYGHVSITPEDIPWLRGVVASTLAAVVASQAGNLP